MWDLRRAELIEPENRMVVPGAGGWEKWGDTGQKVQPFIYKIKLWGSNVHHGDYSTTKYCIAKAVDLTRFHYTHKNRNCVKWWMCSFDFNNISQSIHTLNHPMVHFKCAEFYSSIIS